MGLNYDFDIVAAIPAGDAADLGLGDGLTNGALVALFRDPATAEALRAAPDWTRDIFDAAGFGLTTADSGAGPGRYFARDEAARTSIIEKLTEAITNAPPPPDAAHSPDPGAFDHTDFLDQLIAAEPVEPAEPSMALPEPARPAPKKPRHELPDIADLAEKVDLAARNAVPDADIADGDAAAAVARRPFSGDDGFRMLLGLMAVSGFAVGWFVF